VEGQATNAQPKAGIIASPQRHWQGKHIVKSTTPKGTKLKIFSKAKTRTTSQISQEIADYRSKLAALEAEIAALDAQSLAIAAAETQLYLDACDDKTIDVDQESKRHDEILTNNARQVKKNAKLINAYEQKLARLILELENAEAQSARNDFKVASKASIAAARRFDQALEDLFTVVDAVRDTATARQDALVKLGVRENDWRNTIQTNNVEAIGGLLGRKFRDRYQIWPVDYLSMMGLKTFTEFIESQGQALQVDIDVHEGAPSQRCATSEAIEDVDGSGNDRSEPGGDEGSGAPAFPA
jgi:hypothetical protein